MNSIAGLIKMASFMCPILAFANKSLFSDFAGAAVIPENTDQNTVNICSKIIGYITRSGNEGLLTIDDTGTGIDFLDKAHNNGVIEGIVSFVGIGSVNRDGSIEKKIKDSIRSVVRRTIKNTIKTVFETATFYQKTICIVFITLLSTHIYLTLCMNNTKNSVIDTEKYYKSYIEYAYDNMTNSTMKIDFGNKSILNTTGGKKASKSRRAAKPRATRAAKAVSKAIAKVAAAKPKPKSSSNATKPTKPKAAKPTKAAKAAPKKKK
jgi:hypothetical protein